MYCSDDGSLSDRLSGPSNQVAWNSLCRGLTAFYKTASRLRLKVLKIRSALRQKKQKALRDVVVERVMNMQGEDELSEKKPGKAFLSACCSLGKNLLCLAQSVYTQCPGPVSGKEFRALFISTVRTRHLIENPPHSAAALAASSRSGVAECDGEGSDFGFLSDQKLLNTALTRARSAVLLFSSLWAALFSAGSEE